MAVFVIVVLGAPALLRWGDLVKFPFDEAPARALEKSRPQAVFIGDSMLRSRLEPKHLNEIADIRCDLLAYPGSGSALWYLLLKNVVATLERAPQWTVIMFRDRQLTLPAFRTEGRYRNGLEVYMRGPDPEFEARLAAAGRDDFPVLDRFLLALYPAQKHRLECREDFQERALNLVANRWTKPLVRDGLRDAFDLKHLRKTAATTDSQIDEEKERLNADSRNFSAVIENSFLPMMFREAARRQIRLVFYRVKCHPRHGNAVDPDNPQLRQYILDLRGYLESQGATFIDESPDPEVTAEYYATDDHVTDSMMRPYTELFWRKLRPLLSGGAAEPVLHSAP